MRLQTLRTVNAVRLNRDRLIDESARLLAAGLNKRREDEQLIDLGLKAIRRSRIRIAEADRVLKKTVLLR